jgi:alkylation response protein AidB-like acyl-CoA dehydrogenase
VLQVHGGAGYFTNEPYERMMRDARINTIGEGANEVLKSFIALVGIRDIGEEFKQTLEGLKSPSKFAHSLWRFGRDRLIRLAKAPEVAVASKSLRREADTLAVRLARFAWAVERALIKHREALLDRQYVLERIADAAIALTTASCTLARLDHELSTNTGTEAGRAAGRLYLHMAARRFDQALRELRDNDDEPTNTAAGAVLRMLPNRGLDAR